MHRRISDSFKSPFKFNRFGPSLRGAAGWLTGLQMTKPELDAAFGKPELGFSAFGWQGKDLAPKRSELIFLDELAKVLLV